MKFKSLKKFSIIQDQKTPFDLKNNLLLRLEGLDLFAQYIQERLPNEFSDILKEINYITYKYDGTVDIVNQFNIANKIGNHQEIKFKIIESYLYLINYDKYKKSGNDFEILVYDYVRGFLLIGSIYLKALVKVFGRDRGISIYQEYSDHRTTTGKHYTPMENIEEFLFVEGAIPPIFIGSFDAIQFDLGDGRVGTKIKKCKWATVLEELNDQEYAYALACHYDFHACKCSNPNFELSRTQTVTVGKESCDFVWHDKRRNPNLEHPDKCFWDRLESEEEVAVEENSRIELTKEQQEFDTKCREVYNSGRMKESYEMTVDAYKNNPNDLYYKYMYAVQCGDYHDDKNLPEDKQKKLLATAKKLIKEVFEDETMPLYPEKLVYAIKNEYYFFHQLHEEQFNLGKERVAKGNLRGYYSMCVGATELACQYTMNSNADQAKIWAQKALDAFAEFEKVDPHWYNINHFAAISLAIVGKQDEAITVYKDMYRKQGSQVNEQEVTAFIKTILLPYL
ncbi:MAG: L-2-amino-thiazoline-4-carboxylic acid hydrolase [Oligoflexia bacterium]|nr:L-2-amino-thiazoline-4-carboxylic acid hydrolase [Oligoflexia bacterium]